MRIANSIEEVIKKCGEIETGIKFVINDVQTIVKSNYGFIHCMDTELESVLAAVSNMQPGFAPTSLSDNSCGLTSMKGTVTSADTIIARYGSGLPAMIYNRVFYVLRDGLMEYDMHSYTSRARFCWFVTNFANIYSHASELSKTSPKQLLSVVCNFGAGHKIIPFTELRGIVASDFIGAQKLCSLQQIATPKKVVEKVTTNRKTCANCFVEFASEIKMKTHYKDCKVVPAQPQDEPLLKYPTYVLGWNQKSEFDNIVLLTTYGPRYELAKNFSYTWRNSYHRDIKFYNIQCYSYSAPLTLAPNCHNCKTPLYDDCYAKIISGIARGLCALCIHHFPRVGGTEKIIRTKVPVSVHDVIDLIPIVKNRNHKKYLDILHMLFRGMRSHGKFLIDDTSRTVLYTDNLQSLLSSVSTLGFTPTEIYSVSSF